MKIRTTGLRLSEDFYRSEGYDPFWLAPTRGLATCWGCIRAEDAEVLGFDDEMSADHDWSARVIVFVDAADVDQVEAVQDGLRAAMPARFSDVPTVVDVTTVDGYFQRELGLNVSAQWDASDWLSLPEHRLCAVTSGGVFHDEVGLNTVRERLSYYPRGTSGTTCWALVGGGYTRR